MIAKLTYFLENAMLFFPGSAGVLQGGLFLPATLTTCDTNIVLHIDQCAEELV